MAKGNRAIIFLACLALALGQDDCNLPGECKGTFLSGDVVSPAEIIGDTLVYIDHNTGHIYTGNIE